jgi:hypothetical protein
MRSQIQNDRRRNAGVLAGILGCVFAVLGIFTLGFLFIPIAALCSLIGLLNGISGLNIVGIAISTLSVFLTVVGLAFSPVLLLMLGISLAGHQVLTRTNDASNAVISTTRIEPKNESQSQENMPCPVGGGIAVLSGIASRQLSNGRRVFILKTDKPFCLTLTPPLAPRQRAVLSSVEIDGQPPPLGVTIELTGKLYANPLTADGNELPVLTVASGKRKAQ